MEFVWIFNSSQQGYPGGVFSELDTAEPWIAKHALSGMLTRYPLDTGVFEWALEKGFYSPTPEKLKRKLETPGFIGSFTSASQEHYHYEAGTRIG